MPVFALIFVFRRFKKLVMVPLFFCDELCFFPPMCATMAEAVAQPFSEIIRVGLGFFVLI